MCISMVICCSETRSDKQLGSESCYQYFREVLHALIRPWLSMRFTQSLPPLCIRPSVSACQDLQREVENSQGHKVHPSSTCSLSFNSHPLVHTDTGTEPKHKLSKNDQIKKNIARDASDLEISIHSREPQAH